jgi:hypothetical protein
MSVKRGNTGTEAMPSDRSFGFVFSAAFLLAFTALLYLGHGGHWWALLMSALFLAAALLKPALLSALNRAWARFGALLHAIVNPVLLGIIYFLIVTPTGLLMRLFGKDPLRLRIERSAESYWIKRDPAGPNPESLPRQF